MTTFTWLHPAGPHHQAQRPPSGARRPVLSFKYSSPGKDGQGRVRHGCPGRSTPYIIFRWEKGTHPVSMGDCDGQRCRTEAQALRAPREEAASNPTRLEQRTGGRCGGRCAQRAQGTVAGTWATQPVPGFGKGALSFRSSLDMFLSFAGERVFVCILHPKTLPILFQPPSLYGVWTRTILQLLSPSEGSGSVSS